MQDKNKTKRELLEELESLRKRLSDQEDSAKRLAKLDQETRESRERYRALLDAAHAVIQSRDFAEAARVIFQACKAVTGAGAGYVALLSKDGKKNEVVYLDSGGYECTVPEDTPMPVRGFRKKALERGEPIFNNRFSETRYTKYLPEGHSEVENVLFAPMVMDEKSVGLLGLSNKPAGFTDEDARLAGAFADLAAVSLSRVRNLEVLAESEERFRAVAETASDAIVTVDSGGRVVFWNQGAELMFDRTREEMQGKALTSVMPPRFRRRHRQAFKKAVSSGGTPARGMTLDMFALREDGTEFPVELSLASFVTPDDLYFTGIIRDITERKHYEQSLRAAAEEWQRTFDTIPDMVMILDDNHRVVRVNRAQADVLGITPDQAVGRYCFEMLHNTGQPHPQCPHHNTMQTGDESTAEVFEPRLDAYFLVTTTPLAEPGGNAGASVHVMRDVTEMKRAEEELRHSRELALRRLNELESIYQSAPAGLCVFDEDLRYQSINERMAEINGVPASRHIGKTVREVVPALADQAEKLHRRIFETGEPVLDIEFSGTTKTQPGVLRTWIEHWMPLKDLAGEVIGINVVAHEITDRKRLEEELKKHRDRLEELVEGRTAELRRANRELMEEIEQRGRSEEKLQDVNALLESFFATSHVMIAYMDRDFNFIRVNNAYAQAGRRAPEDFIGLNHFEVYPHAENESIFRRVVETGEPYTVTAKAFDHPDQHERGMTFWDWSLIPVKDEKGEVEALVLYLVDATERVQAEQDALRAKDELERQRAQAVHADRLRSLGQMAAGISHELNQPLQGVHGLAEHIFAGLSRGWELDAKDVRENARIIMEQAERMHHVIEHTRMFAREAESFALSAVDVNKVVTDSLGMIGAQLKSRGVVLELELAPEVPRVLANPFSLEEVILNLMSNARDALSEEHGKAKGGVRLKTGSVRRHGKELVWVEVSDDGPGIPDDIVGSLCDPFFTTKPPDQGTGLGLAICKSIVEGFSGRIEFESGRERGAVVRVLLPALEEV